MLDRRPTARLRVSAAAAALSAALLLSGCGFLPSPSLPSPSAESAEPSPQGETGDQAQQCAQLMSDVEAIAADVGRVGSLLGSNPLEAIALVRSISDRVGELQTRVTDPELLERIAEIQAGWDAVVADAQEVATDPAAFERITTGLTQLGEQVAALQEFCAGTA